MLSSLWSLSKLKFHNTCRKSNLEVIKEYTEKVKCQPIKVIIYTNNVIVEIMFSQTGKSFTIFDLHVSIQNKTACPEHLHTECCKPISNLP